MRAICSASGLRDSQKVTCWGSVASMSMVVRKGVGVEWDVERRAWVAGEAFGPDIINCGEKNMLKFIKNGSKRKVWIVTYERRTCAVRSIRQQQSMTE